jgi:hypothetical protein
MTNETYRKFWERFLGRYPDFKPTLEQTEDWRRELRNKEPHMLEAAVATVVAEKSSQQPRLPWFINAYYKIRNERLNERNASRRETEGDSWHISDEVIRQITEGRERNIKTLQDKTPIEELRRATSTVIKKYGEMLKMPKDGNVAEWSPWLRAAVYCEIYGC